MIGRIRGVLLEASPSHLLLEVGSVGYEIEAPLSTFEPAAGEGTHRGEGSFATYRSAIRLETAWPD